MVKHTGEKPFKCVVPGCDRMFSRFDNMMQHTQTHQANRTKVKDDTRKPTLAKKRPDLSIEPISYEPQQQVGGLVSPVSLGSPETIPCLDDEGQRRLSVADLCHRTNQKEIHLTQDEFEALQAFGRFHYTPVYYDSLRDLASIACIEPSPDKNTNDA
ncbi:hypothetical protein EC973_005303 [Apophysomyces ossiformis]|uniref:C2H2-type domain-containing protein n=1 Tax=Apophysomyces ossiformis TaxID=679940 RepID=A0A8H7BX59_9FUNG|nr:hypothetical protein EC973_005303 [Apophysomyces ossiformis]